jgi:cytoskeletal protein RodZ
MAAFSLSAQSKQRQIVILAVGAVALGGLLLFQIPRTLERLNPPAASTSQATQTAPARSTAKRTAAQPARVVPRETTPAPQRLHLLTRFRSKDPFIQQVDANESAGSDGPTSSAPAASASSGPAPSAPASSAPATPAAPETAKPARPTFTVESAGADGSAMLLVNGEEEKVRVAGTFPKGKPVFRLVSLKDDTAKIGIAGGTLKGGSQTVTLTKGEPLTLLNTVNGKRYRVELGATSRK